MRETSRGPGESQVWRDVLFFVMILSGGLFLVGVPIALFLWLIRSIK
jgi:hypothetical protein